ncbi:hypothetical protein IV102_02220 [bacterium]|nr:hypothetical protein [bacterium]
MNTISSPPWIPTVHPALDDLLATGESALAEGRAAEAQRQFEEVFRILEEDDPVDPSFIKAYVMSRRALARAHQKQADALEEVQRCRSYIGQWDSRDGLYRLSISLTAGQIQRLLGRKKAARSDMETLWTDLKAAKESGGYPIAALLRAVAAELEALGVPRPPQDIPPASAALAPQTAGPSSPALVNYVFLPRFQHRLRIGPVEMGPNTYSGADGSVAWFNPHSEADVKLLMGQPEAVLETDDPGVLAKIGDNQYHPHSQFVLYQPWREPVENRTVRLIGAMVASMSGPAGESLAKSHVKHFFFVTGGVFRGSLGAFKEGLAGHQLETLGIVWHFTGDDITDVPTMVEEIADLARACSVQKLSLVTAAFNRGVERQMVQHFATVPSLRQCSVWREDRGATYPRFNTPKLDAWLAKRSS